jgi:general secretion pathway protein F
MSAFDSARDLISNRFLSAGLAGARDDLRDGRGLAQTLADHAVLPKGALQMIAVGEESGRLHEMLTRLAESLEKQSERQIDDMMTLLTPALTLIIAGLIGAFIFTVMSAILSINELAVQ